ncbi:MAG: hypothetical protein PHV47_00615 [Candidatus Pacebacteria bacterium]|nr:hypothetical protein [Candidatus Paceibacterota bacterium]MDD5620980.1 hypothetical protein [Candidatus Paceibacterota bacterium]
MQFFDLKTQLNSFPIFTKTDIGKIDPGFHDQRLSEWQKKGYIKKIRQGFYIFSDSIIDQERLFVISNKIYQPSYISLEMALSMYNLIPEATYAITSVSSRRSNQFKTIIGTFMYKYIKPRLMFGYVLKENTNNSYLIAEIEKAILDYFYLHPEIRNNKDFDSLRINKQELSRQLDTTKLNQYLTLFKNNNLANRINNLLAYIKK